MKSASVVLVLAGLGLGAFGAAASSGCFVESRPPPPQTGTYAVEPPPAPPTPIVERPAPPQPEVIVEEPPPPPPPLIEPERPAPPSPGNVWVAGSYTWGAGHRYEWQHGHYERPPRPDAHHVAGHWEARGHGRAWVEPHWE